MGGGVFCISIAFGFGFYIPCRLFYLKKMSLIPFLLQSNRELSTDCMGTEQSLSFFFSLFFFFFFLLFSFSFFFFLFFFFFFSFLCFIIIFIMIIFTFFACFTFLALLRFALCQTLSFP